MAVEHINAIRATLRGSVPTPCPFQRKHPQPHHPATTASIPDLSPSSRSKFVGYIQTDIAKR